jgi:hypothetical protein
MCKTPTAPPPPAPAARMGMPSLSRRACPFFVPGLGQKGNMSRPGPEGRACPGTVMIRSTQAGTDPACQEGPPPRGGRPGGGRPGGGRPDGGTPRGRPGVGPARSRCPDGRHVAPTGTKRNTPPRKIRGGVFRVWPKGHSRGISRSCWLPRRRKRPGKRQRQRPGWRAASRRARRRRWSSTGWRVP